MMKKNSIASSVKTDLPKLYNELEGKLISAECLGRTQEKYSDFLIPLVESIPPEEILMSWERKQNSGDVVYEVQSAEMVALARSSFDANSDFKRHGRDNKISPPAAASSLISTSF